MCETKDIRILVCNQEPLYLEQTKQTLFSIGLEKIFTADSHVKIDKLSNTQKFDIALVDTDFNGTGGFKTGESLLKKFPDIFILYITDSKRIMDPIKSIFSGAAGFIIKDNHDELKHKVSIWTTIVSNVKNVKEILNAGESP